jgi:hypothetical protein
MIAVIIIAAGILHHRGDPNRCKSESLDVIKLFYEPFKITSPGRIPLIQAFAIPALYIVLRISIVKACGYDKVDGFIAKICTGEILTKGEGLR